MTRILDRFEQVAAVLLLSFLIYRVWPKADDLFALSSLLLIGSEGIIVFFLLIRRSATDLSLRIRDWILAAAGTFLPLLIVGVDQTTPPLFAGAEVLSVFLLIIGITLHLAAKLSLNRSFGLAACRA